MSHTSEMDSVVTTVGPVTTLNRPKPAAPGRGLVRAGVWSGLPQAAQGCGTDAQRGCGCVQPALGKWLLLIQLCASLQEGKQLPQRSASAGCPAAASPAGRPTEAQTRERNRRRPATRTAHALRPGRMRAGERRARLCAGWAPHRATPSGPGGRWWASTSRRCWRSSAGPRPAAPAGAPQHGCQPGTGGCRRERTRSSRRPRAASLERTLSLASLRGRAPARRKHR